MKLLFNCCSRSDIAVSPQNWKAKNVNINKRWRVYYRFFDPAFKDDPERWGKQFASWDMNQFKDRADRQEATQGIINLVQNLLDVQGYNPITGQYMRPPVEDMVIGDIAPSTPFITALQLALKKVDVVQGTKIDMGCVIRGVEEAASKLYDNRLHRYYTELAISEISRRHIKTILELCATLRKRWSNNRHNMYKTYLSCLFKELLELEAVDMNPTRDVSSKRKIRKIRELFTPEELQRIDVHLKEKNYYFWRYFRIFFYSGARTTELFQLRKNKHVKLEEQYFIVTVKKGNVTKEDIRGISNEALELWKEVWQEAKHGQVLFSVGLKPGDKPIRKDQALRRWVRLVKDDKTGLGIKKDFYSLKHTHTDAVAAKLDLAHAQAADGHTTPIVTMIYAPGEKRRQLDRVKNAGIKIG
jgi:integrase